MSDQFENTSAHLTLHSNTSETHGGVSLFEKDTWTIEETASELQCSVRLLRRLVSDNRIPYGKVGRLVRFYPPRVREWRLKGGSR